MLTELPQRVRLVVLGTDLHGLAVAQDLLSRGWSDIILLDPDFAYQNEHTSFQLESLFSLFNFRDFRHIPKAIEELDYLGILGRERCFHLNCQLNLTDLALADQLFYRGGVQVFRRLTKSLSSRETSSFSSVSANQKKSTNFLDVYVCWHQLRRNLLAKLKESRPQIVTGVQSLAISPINDGWRLSFFAEKGEQELSALFVVNALGLDANHFLAQNRLPITWPAVHRELRSELYRDHGSERLTEARIWPRHGNRQAMQIVPVAKDLVLLSREQKRWRGMAERTSDDSHAVLASEAKILGYKNSDSLEFIRTDIHHFAVPYESQKHFGSLRNPSPFITSEHRSGRGLMLTMYNLKAMTHRSFAEEIGDRLMKHFGENRQSRTRFGGPKDSSHLSE